MPVVGGPRTLRVTHTFHVKAVVHFLCWEWPVMVSSPPFIRLMDPPLLEHSPLRLPPPSPPLTLTSYHTLHDSSRLCGKRQTNTPAHFHVSHPVKFHAFFPSSPRFAMAAAYLRSLFGSSSSHQSTTPAHGKAKTRSRTESTPAPSPFYVYTPHPGTTPSTSTSSSGTSLSKVQLTNSNNTPVVSSSPVGYLAYDSGRSHEDSRPRPPLYRATSHKHGP